MVGEKGKTRRLKQRNFVAKHAAEFNRSGAHRERNRYQRRDRFLSDALIKSTKYERDKTETD